MSNESIFDSKMNQSWHEGQTRAGSTSPAGSNGPTTTADKKGLARSNSAPIARSRKATEDPKRLKRVGSENPKALRRRRSSFRAGGSKYLNPEGSTTSEPQKMIFADEIGSALEEAYNLEQSYYKPAPGQDIRPDELSDFHIEVENDMDLGTSMLKVVPVHLYGTIVLVGNAVQFNQTHAEAVARIFRATNEQGDQAYQPKQLKKAPIAGFEKLIWKCNTKKPASDVLQEFQASMHLSEFNIEMLGSKPMDFIATDSNIVGLVRQLRSQGRTVPADRYFCSAGRTLAELEMAQQYKNGSDFGY